MGNPKIRTPLSEAWKRAGEELELAERAESRRFDHADGLKVHLPGGFEEWLSAGEPEDFGGDQ